MRAATTKNLHVPLSAKLYRELRRAAEVQGRPATQVAREAIALWLGGQRRRAIEDELRAYVAAAAGTSDDLDSALVAASAEHLSKRRKR
jgi:predicted transcriptional regulator